MDGDFGHRLGYLLARSAGIFGRGAIHGSSKMNPRTKQLLGLIFVISVGLFSSAERAAHASVFGYVSGTWKFWNKNGNYCPTTNACVGSRYTQDSYNTLLPISNAAVLAVDSATGHVLGQGVTATDGTFSFSWSGVNANPIRVVVFPQQKDGRFSIWNSSGGVVSNTTGPLVPTFPTTNAGMWYVGSSISPNWYYNAYWAVERQWRDVLALVGVELDKFTNIQIRGFARNMPDFLGDCQSSCSNGGLKSVQLDDGAGLMPQGRAMHEMGHIAEYVAHPWSRTMNYNWPDTSTFSAMGDWSRSSGEWGAPAFEEAFATHYGNIAFWNDNSTTPTTCTSAATCYQNGAPISNSDIEASSYPFATNNCSTAAAAPEARWPLSQMRYLWDVFDNHFDADGDEYSANQGDFWMHLAVLANYPNGTGTDQIDEPLTNRDGRGSGSYHDNYLSMTTHDTGLLRTDNCSPF
jgi:hypothetical protein